MQFIKSVINNRLKLSDEHDVEFLYNEFTNVTAKLNKSMSREQTKTKSHVTSVRNVGINVTSCIFL